MSTADRSSPVTLMSGMLLSLLAVGLMWRAYHTLTWRMKGIASRSSTQVEDRLGPLLIAGALAVALLAAAVVTISRRA